MKAVPQSLENLIDEFSKLPGIGKKTAERLSIYILKANEEQVFKFSETLTNLKNNIKKCEICHSFIDKECVICMCPMGNIRYKYYNCSHIDFCQKCLEKWSAKSGENNTCPICRKEPV